MGADGGVEWMKLKQPSKYGRLMELLWPFNIRTYEGLIDVCASYNSNFHDEWCEENPEICEPKYLLSIYGTDLPGFPCLSDIPGIVEYLKDAETQQFPHELFILGINPKVHTFGDIILEKNTRPSSVGYYCKLPSFLEELEEGSVLDSMIISDWVDEVESILDINSCCSCETWT